MAKILIVDDLGALRKSVRFLLKMNGYEVVEAVNGKDALKVLQETKIDLVIIDLKMPVMGGAEAIIEMRKIEGYQKTPVFLYSAFSKTESAVKVKDLVSESLDKPIDTNLLLELIKKHLS